MLSDHGRLRNTQSGGSTPRNLVTATVMQESTSVDAFTALNIVVIARLRCNLRGVLLFRMSWSLLNLTNEHERVRCSQIYDWPVLLFRSSVCRSSPETKRDHDENLLSRIDLLLLKYRV